MDLGKQVVDPDFSSEEADVPGGLCSAFPSPLAPQHPLEGDHANAEMSNYKKLNEEVQFIAKNARGLMDLITWFESRHVTIHQTYYKVMGVLLWAEAQSSKNHPDNVELNATAFKCLSRCFLAWQRSSDNYCYREESSDVAKMAQKFQQPAARILKAVRVFDPAQMHLLMVDFTSLNAIHGFDKNCRLEIPTYKNITKEGAGEPRRRFRRAARALAHLCGLSLWRKRYVGKSPVIQWAIFHLKRQTHLGSDLLFNINDYSTTNLRGDFEKLKHLLYICPKERSQRDLRQIQTCLKKNRTFQCLPNKTQLQLCHAVVYQECEAGTIIIRQGHVPSECYLILSGKLKVLWSDANFKAQTFTSEILCEAEEGDFIGEICLLTNTNRSASIICKSDVELLVINKEDFDCILSDLLHEQYRATCNFLRKLTLFSSWSAEEIDFLVHCSLERFYRTGTTVVPESLNSYFLVVVKSGRCLIVTQVDQERLYAHSNEMQNFSSLCDDFITISSLKEKKDLTRRLWERSLYSAAQRTPLTQMPRRPRPQTAAVLCYSLRDGKAFGDLKQKHVNLIEGTGEKVAETKRGGRKQKACTSQYRESLQGIL
ncbi:uncharacterized protein LOC116826253 [Chelonoidis abingdonii]|uniref:uncharacterized protein LOC116826253 n=1 Tax=Chelonoidis abingdonii TaxID=106734 RepID=UPI003F492C1E